MKFSKIILALSFIIISFATQAQVGIGTNNPAATAQLEVSSTSKGFLPPRMTYTQKVAITNPASGLIIWCSDCGSNGELQVFNGSSWTNLVGGSASAVSSTTVGSSYAGGIVAYIFQNGDPGYVAGQTHGLIVASADQSAGTLWWNGSYVVTNASGTALGTGLSNTNTIITAQGNTGNYAAKLCRDYNGGGYTDWFLPSKDELNKICNNRATIGGFGNYYYWTSSEVDLYEVHWQKLGDATTGTSPKSSNILYVRAVRYF